MRLFNKNTNKFGRSFELVKNTIIFAIGTLGTKLIMFLLVPLYSTYMTAAEFGEADLIISSMSMIHPILCLGIDQAIIRFGLTKKSGKEEVLKIAINISIIGVLVLIIILLVLHQLEIVKKYWLTIILTYIGISFTTVLSNYSKTVEKNIVYAINSILHAVVLCVLNIIFIVELKAGINGYIISIIGAYLFSIVFLTVLCKSLSAYFKYKFNFGLAKEMIRYSLPLVPNVLSWWIIQMSDRYMITFFSGVSLNGFYTMAYKIPSVFNLLVSIFMQAFDITVFKEVDRGIDRVYVEKIYRYYISISFIGGSLIMVLIRPISSLILRNDFSGAWIYVPLLLFAYIISNLQAFYGVLYGGFKATQISFKSTVIGAFANIILNLVLIPQFEAFGAAIATILSYIIIYIIRMIKMNSLFVFESELIRITISVSLIFWEMVLYMTNDFVASVACIGIVLVISFIYRQECAELFHTISSKVRGLRK